MNENTRSRFRSVIRSVNFRNFKELKSFMRQLDLHKSPEKRFFSWLIAFGILDFEKEKWFETITDIIDSYHRLVKTNFGTLNDNLFTEIDKNFSYRIDADIERLIPCLIDSFKSLNLKNITSECLGSYKESVKKILALSSLFNKKYVYLQGYDRYIVPVYMYAVGTFGVDSELTEPLTFRLYIKILDMANPSFFLESKSLAKSMFFLKLHTKFLWNRPDIIKKIKPVSDWEKIITIRWLLLTYADEYPLQNLLLLWDYIFLNNNKFAHVRDLLCVEHLLQLPKVKDPQLYYADIQNKNDWDLEIILTHLDKKIDTKSKKYSMMYFALIMTFLFFVFISCRRYLVSRYV